MAINQTSESRQTSDQVRTDDTGVAPESGEPAVAGRSHGRVIDERPAGTEKAKAGDDHPAAQGAKGNAGKLGEDFESGRQDAV